MKTLLIALVLFASALSVSAQEYTYGVLLWTLDENEYVWNVSGLYDDFDRDAFKLEMDNVTEQDGSLVDYIAVYGLNGFELKASIDNLAFVMLIFQREG